MRAGTLQGLWPLRPADAPALARGISARLCAHPSATVPALRKMRRGWSRSLRDAPAGVVVEAAVRLSRMPLRGHRFVAYELIRHHPAAPSRMNSRQLGRLGLGMDSWDEVDCFSAYLAGPAWRGELVSDGVIHRWARSADLWWRRAALVSTVALNSRANGGTGDVRRTLRVCRMLERDREPMIVKALSWALRELAKRQPRAVRAFVADRSGSLAAMVLREVRNKLTTGLKNPRKSASRRGAT